MHSDHLNTPRMLSDENGTVVWTWFADAFGTEFKGGYGLDAPDPDPDGNGQKVWYQLRFPGQYKSYNYFRDINRSTGRYLQPDPIGLAGGLNTYLYAVANPLQYSDPYGVGPGGAAVAGGACVAGVFAISAKDIRSALDAKAKYDVLMKKVKDLQEQHDKCGDPEERVGIQLQMRELTLEAAAQQSRMVAEGFPVSAAAAVAGAVCGAIGGIFLPF